jgi:hypothetical protein
MLQDIINHTLKNPKTGQWSRKNITGCLCVTYAMFYSTYGLFLDRQIQEVVVTSFLGAGLICLGISSWEKLSLSKKDQPAEVV